MRLATDCPTFPTPRLCVHRFATPLPRAPCSYTDHNSQASLSHYLLCGMRCCRWLMPSPTLASRMLPLVTLPSTLAAPTLLGTTSLAYVAPGRCNQLRPRCCVILTHTCVLPLPSSQGEFSLEGFRCTRLGIAVTTVMVRVLEFFCLAPKGNDDLQPLVARVYGHSHTVATLLSLALSLSRSVSPRPPAGTSKMHDHLVTGARTLRRAGELGIFTPMLYVKGRKPLNA